MRLEFLNLDAAGLARLTALKVPIFAARAAANTVLYVPTGFILCEHCGEGTLFYGVRRSCIFPTKLAVSRFKKLVEIDESHGKEVAKTKKLLESIEQAVPKEK